MADAEIQQLRRPSADNQTVSKADIPLKERFFRYFQHEITGMFSLIRTQTPLRCQATQATGSLLIKVPF
jgi:hypothetical protein